jgi:hypothetical protein
MKQMKRVSIALLAITAAAVLVFGGSAWATEEDFDCQPKVTVDENAAGKGQLEGFTCFFKAWDGAKALHFKVTIKNISDTPQRYRVHIFLDNGKAVGGLIPQKTKKGLVAPGTSASFVYPVKGMADKPNDISLIIKTISQ